MELTCAIKNYEWGKTGKDSMVATLIKSSKPDFDLIESLPYAELWMGTHPNGPSFIKNENVPLEHYIQENTHILGKTLIETFGDNIPFLFKVLSIKKALSIQVHPNKEQAEILHQTKPDVYKDANHKPELAIALTKFEALCGFRPIFEIKNYLRSIPELCHVIGNSEITNLFSSNETNFQSILKNCFANLMLQDSQVVAEQLRKLIKRFSNLDETMRENLNAALLEQLYLDYPDDVGCFCIYLFNYLSLQPGNAIYINANEPHAYLYGDCIECMACSDNVIRAGLTPKMKDVETLISTLSYVCEPGSLKQFQPFQEDKYTEIFRPPIQDFAVAKITIPAGKSYDLIPRETASILIIIAGKVEISNFQTLGKGSVLFLPAKENINFKTLSPLATVTIFQAFANV